MASKILVVYYSRSGTTRAVARDLAAALDADVEELRDRADRAGVLGYARTCVEQVLGTSTELALPHKVPARYDLVIIGSPVFVGAPSPASRTYLWLEQEHLPRVALFVTYGGSWAERALARMAALAGSKPVATLAIRAAEVAGPDRATKLAPFIRAVQTAMRPATPRRRAAR